MNWYTPILRLALVLFLGLVQPVSAQLADTAQSNYSAGVEAYKAGDFRRAFDAWSLGAYEGVTEAQYNLGVLYLEGRGVESNIEQARTWFLKAADQGHVEAQYNLGHMALSGMGVEKSVPEALAWWKQAAEGGYAQAQFNYGRALYLGIGDQRNQPVGLDYIRRAAAQEDPRAVRFLEQNPEAVTLKRPTQTESDTGSKPAPPVAATSGPEPAVAGEDDPETEVSPEKQASPVMASSPAPAKLEIVRDRRQIKTEYLMRTVNEPTDVYPQADSDTVRVRLEPASIVRVTGIQNARLQIETPPGIGISGWIQAHHLAYSGETSQQLRDAWKAHPAPAVEPAGPPVNRQGAAGQADQSTASVKSAPAGSAGQGTVQTQQARSLITPESDTVVSGANGMDDNTWLFTQPPDTHVIHLFTLLNRTRALQIASQPAFRDMAHIYTTKARGQDWVFVLLGPYTSEAAALRAREALPAPYPRDARVRRLDLIAENRCAKRASLSSEQAWGLDGYCLE